MQGFGNKMIFRKFRIERKYYNNLSSSEKKILKILGGVVSDTAKVYLQQLKDGFYEEGITKKDIESVGWYNPELLSPFTYVFRRNGELRSLPYHELYSKFMEPIAKKIEQAAAFSVNQSFKKYLLARAKSLRDGTYNEADKAWLNVKNSNIDFSIGPFERYLDKLLFIKRSFQAHTAIIDKERTKMAEKYKEALFSSAKLSNSEFHSTDIPKKGVNVFIELTPYISGYPADVLFSIEHFPSDLILALEYGSRTIIYSPQLNLKFKKLYYPILKTIFERRFSAKYPKSLLMTAANWCAFLYELGKQLHNFTRSRERLKEMYAPLDEANGFASGIAHAKHLVVKGMISQELLEAIIIIHILWLFADWIYYLKNRHKESHIVGSALLFNYYLSVGALQETGGISWPNFSKIFFCIESMANVLSTLLRDGSYKEAELFIRKNADLGNFEQFSKNLNHIESEV